MQKVPDPQFTLTQTKPRLFLQPILRRSQFVRLYGVDGVINGKKLIAEDMQECGRALLEVLLQLMLGKTKKTPVRTAGDPVSPEFRKGHHPHTKLQPYW